MKTEMKNNPIGVPSLHWTTNCCAATFWWERGAGIRWIRVFGGKCGRRREELNALLKRSPERLMSIMGESRSFGESFRIIDQFDLNGVSTLMRSNLLCSNLRIYYYHVTNRSGRTLYAISNSLEFLKSEYLVDTPFIYFLTTWILKWILDSIIL